MPRFNRLFLLVPILCCPSLFLACEDDSSNGATSGGPQTTFDAGPGTTLDGPQPNTVLTPCTAPTGPGLEHAKEITADETWTAADSPHRITFGIRLLATVTLEPCATVLVDEGYTITVGTFGKPGALIAKGERGVDTSGAPVRRAVTFGALDPTKPWGSITVTSDGKLDLQSTDLSDGANPTSDQNGGGMILAYGKGLASGAVTKNVRAVDVTIDKSRGYGVSFTSLSGFTDDSKDLTIKGSGRDVAAFPVRLEIGALSTLPPLTLTGNVANEVQLVAGNTAMPDDTVRARGVPYRVSGRLRVAPDKDGTPAKLTIEPGVTLRFDSDASDNGLQVGTSDTRQGILFAEGTAAAPITFTSSKSTPTPGDWKNVYFAYSPPAGNRIAHATFEYAGAPSGAQGFGCGPAENDATILILSGRPTDAFIQNTTLRKGGGDTGILLGWSSDLSGPDFVTSNVFVDMPTCTVSRWRTAGNACPGSTAGSPVCL